MERRTVGFNWKIGYPVHCNIFLQFTNFSVEILIEISKNPPKYWAQNFHGTVYRTPFGTTDWWFRNWQCFLRFFSHQQHHSRQPRFRLLQPRSLRQPPRKRLPVFFHQLVKQPCTPFTWLTKVRKVGWSVLIVCFSQTNSWMFSKKPEQSQKVKQEKLRICKKNIHKMCFSQNPIQL